MECFYITHGKPKFKKKETTHANVKNHKLQNRALGLVDSRVGKWVSWLWREEVGSPTHGSERAEPLPTLPAIRLHPAAEYDNVSIFHSPDVTH